MVTQELLEYIKTQAAYGKSPVDIRAALVSNGWPEQQIEQAFVQLGYQMEITSLNQQSLASHTSLGKNILFIGIGLLVVLAFVAVGVMSYRTHFTTNTTVTITPTIMPSPTFNPIPSPTMIPATTVPTTSNVSASGNDCGKVSITILPITPIQDRNDKNLDCFINSTQECTIAKITINSTLNFAGITTSTADYDIQGLQGGKCALHIKQGPVDHIFPSEVPQDQQQIVMQTLQKKVGTEGTCLFSSNADLTEIFTNWKNGNFSLSTDPKEGDFRKADCSGTYFSQN